MAAAGAIRVSARAAGIRRRALTGTTRRRTWRGCRVGLGRRIGCRANRSGSTRRVRGTATSRYWGEGGSGQCRYANGADASTDFSWKAGCNDGHARTAPAGSFAANGWGLHDMLGNVWEWTEDCWNGSYAGGPADGSAWEYGDCSKRVLRGGSWLSGPSSIRAANRNRLTTGGRGSGNGFRVARTLAP